MPGAIASCAWVVWVVGSRRLVADDGRRDRPQGDRDDVALQGRLQGRLQDVAIVEFIQLVCRAHRDAVIEVRDEGCNSSGCGVWTVKNRRVLAAKTENVLVAAAACYAPLSPVRGRFRVLPGHDKIALVLPVEYIAPDTTFLLLDDVPGLETAAQPFTPDPGDEESAPLSEGLRPALIFPLVLHTEASPGCLLRNTPRPHTPRPHTPWNSADPPPGPFTRGNPSACSSSPSEFDVDRHQRPALPRPVMRRREHGAAHAHPKSRRPPRGPPRGFSPSAQQN